MNLSLISAQPQTVFAVDQWNKGLTATLPEESGKYEPEVADLKGNAALLHRAGEHTWTVLAKGFLKAPV